MNRQILSVLHSVYNYFNKFPLSPLPPVKNFFAPFNERSSHLHNCLKNWLGLNISDIFNRIIFTIGTRKKTFLKPSQFNFCQLMFKKMSFCSSVDLQIHRQTEFFFVWNMRTAGSCKIFLILLWLKMEISCLYIYISCSFLQCTL